MRDIKRRIRSVKNTQQITRAMKMVAAAKLRKAQDSVVAARPYSDKLSLIMERLISKSCAYEHPLIEAREEGKIGFVVIAADRGLCGGYNQNVLRYAKQKIDAQFEETEVITVGRKARDYFQRRGYPIREYYLDFGDLPDFIQARELARELVSFYTDKEYKKLYLIYTEFYSAISHKPTQAAYLPVAAECQDNPEHEAGIEYIYEPSEDEVLGSLIPRSVEVMLYRVLLEAKASEHGARMTAMSSATDNAGELIDKLVLSYNRARQAAITKEISEIVGGAAALD